MDRSIVYTGALPQTTDLLLTNKFAMVAQAFQNRALLGSSTAVAGLACTATTPTADLHVTVDVGSIYTMDPTDAAAYGDVGTDNTNIVKQGILAAPQVLTITPPATAGFSQVYLVQAILNDVDAGSMVLSYYNSSNPAQPFAGPANSGASNYTIRGCNCVIALKAGSAASTGTQTTPSADAGYVGLYAITVANGQTQITSANIKQVASAPFFPTLPAVPIGVQNGTWVYAGQDTGAANAYVITFAAGQPIPTAYVAGMEVKFKAQTANTGASTVNVNGLGTVAIRRGNGVALSANDIVSGGLVTLTYDGTLFQMSNYLGAGATSNTNTTVSIPYVADTGTLNALIATYSPAITSGQQVAGLALTVKLANTITGACTVNVSGLGAKAVMTGDLANPPNGVYVAGEILLLIYDGTQYQIANTSSLTYRKPTANTTIYVNTSTGSDTLYDGTASTVGAGTSGPLKTIQKAVTVAFGYAPSQYTITIQVAAGTYNESVATPFYAGPNIVINGASTASVTVNSGAAHNFYVGGPNTLTVTNLTVQNDGVYPHTGFLSGSGASLNTSNTASNACNIVWEASSNGTINVGSHTFNGSGYTLYYAAFGGSISLSGTHTFSTPISVSLCSANASGIGAITVGALTYVNPSYVSGAKWRADFNGVIAFNGSSDGTGGAKSFFPGNSAGSTSSGGQYAG